VNPAVTARRSVVAAAVASVVSLAGCTSDREPSPPERDRARSPSASPCPSFVLTRNDGECRDTFELDRETFRVTCVAVPEILLDVAVPSRWGGGAVRAIAAVPAAHGVAVPADDPTCGAYALALRADLPADVADAVVGEVERAAALPPDLEK